MKPLKEALEIIEAVENAAGDCQVILTFELSEKDLKTIARQERLSIKEPTIDSPKQRAYWNVANNFHVWFEGEKKEIEVIFK